MKEGVFWTFALTGAGLLVYSVRGFFTAEQRPPAESEPVPEEIEETSLEEVSQNWMGKEVLIQDLSVLWRERKQKQSSPLPRPTFRHEEIDRFFTDMVEQRRSIEGARRQVIIELLKMLDEEGDCPSVVRMNEHEAEKSFKEDTFAMLATIPLYRHTLSVARKSMAKAGQEAILVDFLIVALAHDLGKIPSNYGKMYMSMDHPLISALIVNGIPEYASLPNRTELDKIIRGHHILKTDDTLTNIFKLCDHETRQEELATLLAAARERDRSEGPANTDNAPEKASAQGAGSAKPAALPPEEEREHPLGELASRVPFVPVACGLPAWFDADAILAELGKRINRLMETTDAQKWDAISTAKGVFVHPDGLWSVLKEVSGNDPLLLASDANEEAKRNLLYTVVRELGRTRDAIATEYIAPQYYTTKTSVVTGSGKGITAYLIPFRVHVFAATLSALEELKPVKLKRMVRDIHLKQEEVEKCV